MNVVPALMGSYADPVQWDETVRNAFEKLPSSDTVWPRDTLFKYLMLMASLQENMREYQELQTLAGA